MLILVAFLANNDAAFRTRWWINLEVDDLATVGGWTEHQMLVIRNLVILLELQVLLVNIRMDD